MTKHEAGISIQMLNQLLDVDFKTGELTWKRRHEDLFLEGKQSAAHNCAIWNGRFAGKKAFNYAQGMGYLHGSIFGNKFLAHRVVFAMYQSEWPEYEVDHINGVKTDNRPINLRSVSHAENMRNQKLKINSTTGINGVHFNKSRGLFEAHISVNSKKVSLGRFETAEDARQARFSAEQLYSYHANHGRAAQ